MLKLMGKKRKYSQLYAENVCLGYLDLWHGIGGSAGYMGCFFYISERRWQMRRYCLMMSTCLKISLESEYMY